MRAILTTALAALLLAGCASGSDAGSADTTAPAAAASTAAPSTPVAEPAAVTIKDFDYAPKRLTVAKGTKVSFTNQDAANHTVTFDKSGKDLGNQPKGRTVHLTFTESGTYAYHCDFHPNMHGKVVVG